MHAGANGTCESLLTERIQANEVTVRLRVAGRATGLAA
jgi:hypothetical protein